MDHAGESKGQGPLVAGKVGKPIRLLRVAAPRNRYHLSLPLLMAVIVSGLCLSSFLAARLITVRFLGMADMDWAVRFWAVLVWATSFGLAYGLTVILVRPMKRLVQEAERVLTSNPEVDARPVRRHMGDLEYIGQVFEEVADRLSQMEAVERFPEIIGFSRVMRSLFSQILKAAASEATVLIQGESGTGKELVAESLHRHSGRSGGPLVKVNCAAIPETLVESELFGHEKGAFTGAASQKKGRFELAERGTIFLDEIGDMPLETQAKLLRVLQEKEIERLGGTRPVPVDVRVVAASNRSLRELVRQGKFREDLFYRLNVLNLWVPPLRDRSEDIPVLADHFLRGRHDEVSLSAEARHLLMAYPWPGNVRELQSEIERAAVRTGSGEILPEHLSPFVRHPVGQEAVADRGNRSQGLDERLEAMEKSMILEALRQTGGVQARAAEVLGIKPRSLWHRVKKYNIPVESFKAEDGNWRHFMEDKTPKNGD